MNDEWVRARGAEWMRLTAACPAMAALRWLCSSPLEPLLRMQVGDVMGCSIEQARAAAAEADTAAQMARVFEVRACGEPVWEATDAHGPITRRAKYLPEPPPLLCFWSAAARRRRSSR